jgi:2-polyprenyl-3-methyl-5-hydroxy-6-metoxy-1,4-benzoquinol methylase
MYEEAYGQRKLTFVDRLGVGLSRRPIMQALRDYQNPDVLEIGCGFHAPLLCDLAPRLASGVGIDVSISEQAKRRPHLTFFEEGAESALPKLAGRQFDAILMISVLEHILDPLAVLVTLREMLKPKGALVLNVPNWSGKTFLEFSAFRLGLSPAESIDDHKTYYDKRDLWPLLVRAGFKPSRIKMHYHKLGLNLFAVAKVG